MWCFAFHVQSQEITQTHWLFGNTTDYLTFDRNGRDVYTQEGQALPFGNAGAVVVTDQFTGNMLFYSDGISVYDATHQLISADLNGSNSINVPIVTCPVTGSPGDYYLFTNTGGVGAANEIQYSVVASTEVPNGLPTFGLTLSNQSLPDPLTDPAEGMLIIPNGDGELFWLLSQNRNTNAIQVTRIDEAGVGATTASDGFGTVESPSFEVAHFAFNADSSWVAAAPGEANRDVWVMNFNVETGDLALDTTISTGIEGETIYDVEWSSGGSKLYFSRVGGADISGQLYQVDFDTVLVPFEVLDEPVFRSYGLQRAIDDRIYHLYQEEDANSPYLIGRINLPGTVVDSVSYQADVFGSDFQSLQFPSFTAAYNFTFDTLNFSFLDNCLSNVTKFFPVVEPVPNSLYWEFGDQGSSDAWIPNVEFAEAASMEVLLIAEVAGIVDTARAFFEVLENDLEVDLGIDTTICVDEVLTLDAGDEGTAYIWNTGATTQTIEIDTAGTYWVEVTSSTGCTSYDEIEIIEYGFENQRYNQWYFGEQAGMDFTVDEEGNLIVLPLLDNNQQFAEEGCATVSDSNGDLLFYTNGVTVWNREHEVMLNGDTIGGDVGSAQNSIIMPFNDDRTMFYIFTTQEVYGTGEYAMKYAIVDMKEGGALGEVIVKNVKMMENSTERVTGVGFEGNDFIVVHEFGNNNFRSYATGPGGLSAPLHSPVGEVHAFDQALNGTGYMKMTEAQDLVAVNIPGTGEVEIFDFNQGEVSNPRLIDTEESPLYGMEFAGSTHLFLTTSSSNSKLIRYALDSLNSDDPVADVTDTKYDAFDQGANYGALQLGPDGTIYMAIDNSTVIGTITSQAAEDPENVSFTVDGFDLQGRTSRLGLPNFSQVENDPIAEPSITASNGCVGEELSFSADGRDPNDLIEEYTWIFGDGTTVSAKDTTHIFTEPGEYNVQVVLSNRCDTDTTLSQLIVINTLPVEPDVPVDTLICEIPFELTAYDGSDPNIGVVWSTGDSTNSISITEQGLVDVTLVDLTTGCSSETATVFVADARPDVQLGDDQTICQNEPSITLDAQVVTDGTYRWYQNGVPLSDETLRTLSVSTATAGSFQYVAEVTNIFGCTGLDTVEIAVLEEPVVEVTTSSPSGCGVGDGFIELTLTSDGSFSYQLSGESVVEPLNVDGPATVTLPDEQNLSAGSYDLIVTNLVTGCTYTEVILLEDVAPFDLDAVGIPGCLGEGAITLSFTGASIPTSYTVDVSNETGASVFSGVSVLSVTALDTGTFYIAVEDLDAPNCFVGDTVVITLSNPQPAFTFDSPQQVCQSGEVFVIDGTGGTATYTWPQVVGDNVNDTVSVSQSGTYTVIADGASFCPREEEIEVVVNDDPLVSLTEEGDPCEGQITVVATVTGGSGSYLYEWSDGGGGSQNIVTEDGTYSVDVTDQLTGCLVSSEDIIVTVEEEFEVSLAQDPDCSFNGDIFLIATTNYFDASITYQWQNEAGELLAGTDSIITVSESGIYTVVATNELGTCEVSDQLSVSSIPIQPEDIDLGESATFCSGDTDTPSVDLDPGIFTSYEWVLLPDTTNVLSTGQVLTVSEAGTYQVTLFNGFTCTIVDVDVSEDCRPIIYAPNAFVPNGTNNEFFVYPNDYVETFEVLIYTRWGELVYRSEDMNFRWNGIYRGQLLPLGTYAYVFKFSSSLAPELGVIEQYGSVTLIR